MVALTVYQFRTRFNAELHRQRMITWPEVPALFDADEPISLEPYLGATGKMRLTRLEVAYRFYFNGELREGKNLIPENIRLYESDQQEVKRKLNRQRKHLTVCCNPEEPEDNALLVPHAELSWRGFLVYPFYGVALPFALIKVALYVYQAPTEWWEVLTIHQII